MYCVFAVHVHFVTVDSISPVTAVEFVVIDGRDAYFGVRVEETGQPRDASVGEASDVAFFWDQGIARVTLVVDVALVSVRVERPRLAGVGDAAAWA